MTLKSAAKLEEQLACGLENDIRNLTNSHQSILESVKIGTLMGYFRPKQKMYEFKIYTGVMCHDSKE